MFMAQAICRPLPPIVSQRLREFVYPTEIALRDDYGFVVAGQTGSLLKSSTGDYHGYRFGVHGYFEWRNIAIAKALCRPGDTILEIGANIGTETIGYADIVGPGGKVYAFEPLPSNVAALYESLRLNPGHNVEVFPLAVGACCAPLRFSIPTEAGYSGLGHLNLGGVAGGSETIEVECVTLDSLSARLGPAKAIFMDVEGAEILVLRGARNYLAQCRPAIVLEADARWLGRLNFTPADLGNELSSCAYDLYRMTRLGLALIDPKAMKTEDTAKFSNWFCLHSSNRGMAQAVSRLLKRCGLLPCIAGINPIAGQRPRPGLPG
jgi:FkbM family methyltransferase